MPPAVSVVIPCYNLGAYLDQAVASVLNQSFSDFEIIIVDDGSTDRFTRELLAGYRRPRTRVVRMPHDGLAAARNLGIAESDGRYLCMLDADDELERDFLAKTARVLDEDPSITFVSTWLRTFGEATWDWTPEDCGLPTLLWENTALTASLVRRQAVVAVGGFDSRMPFQGDEDWDLWLALVERGHRGVILSEALFRYRRRSGSMSETCWHGTGHVPLAEYRIRKHGDSYRLHLDAVLTHQDDEICDLLRRNSALERSIVTELEPLLEVRRRELARLTARLHARDAEASLQRAVAEVAALRASMSWRITAPLRAIYGWWLRHRGHA